MYTLYILKCSDGTLYTGIAKDLSKRLEVHKSGKGSKYVRARLPFTLVFQKEMQDKSSSLKEEFRIKKLSREEKELFIKSSKI